MSHLQDTIASPDREYPSIMSWLLAIAEVLNSGGRLAPQKAIQKQLQELVDTYGSDAVWQVIKQFSMTLGIGDAPYAEAQFRSHPDLPNLLQTEESAKKINHWFQEKSAIVSQAHQLLCGLSKLVPPNTTSKFAKGEFTPEQREVLGQVFQILGKEPQNESSSTLC